MVLGLDALGNAFNSFFTFLINDIFTPIFILVMVGIFFFVQYLFIKLYIFVFSKLIKGMIKVIDFVKKYNVEKFLDKIFS